MPKSINKPSRVAICVFAILLLRLTAQAQQEKGDFEVLAFGGGFNIGVGDNSGSSNYNIGGLGGYFITRRHEVGGGVALLIVRSRIRFGDKTRSDTSATLSLIGLYRYNFASKDSKLFPFVVIEASVTTLGDFFESSGGERVRLRPHGGLKIFLKKNVALDISVGGSFNVLRDDGPFGSRDAFIDGRFDLSFVF